MQLMCDEYEQKLDRLKALDERVEELKQKQGELSLSGRELRMNNILYTMYIHVRCTMCIYYT